MLKAALSRSIPSNVGRLAATLHGPIIGGGLPFHPAALRAAAPSLAVDPPEEQRRFMSKYLSKSATKRLGLTSKRVRRHLNKGYGSTKEGKFVKGNKFRMIKSMMLELVVPDLTGFKLKPYIAASVPREPPEQRAPTPGN
mmetsp:Transcript_14252/g.29328  ORF Transcript_14252/g.29328 Transcript_14252/m.29328 type:complete len:140 (-) Transcript_14252:275-694(-)